MLERTLVYVDTSYLLASFYNSWETGARAQLEIDLREVVRVLDGMISRQLGQPIQRQLWYDGIPESGPHRYQRSLRSIDGVQLRVGQLIEWGNRRIQKAVDTRLVADMVIAGLRRQASDIVLVSGDADMLPGVAEASAAGVRVHLYGFGWDSMSSALRHACDSTTVLDPREDFAEAMQINVLEGPLPPVVRGKPVGDAEPPERDGATAVPDTRTTPPGSPDPGDGDRRDTAATADASGPAADPADAGGAATAGAPVAGPASAGDATADGDPATDVGDPGDSPTAATAAPGTAAPAGERGDGAAPDTGPAAGRTVAASPTAGADRADAPGATDAPGAAGRPGPAPDEPDSGDGAVGAAPKPAPRPSPSMMAPRRRLRSRYVPLPNEVWASAGFQTPFDVGQQYASWWYESAATEQQRDEAHLLSGGGLPTHIDRPLLQFACETLHEYTLTESQRVNLRDGFHAGIRSLLLNRRRDGGL